MSKFTHIIGIDESGRGPLAGPVFLGAVCMRRANLHYLEHHFVGLKDPKRMTAKQREEWFVVLKEAEERRIFQVSVTFSSHATIDAHGIVPAIRFALHRASRRIKAPRDTTRVLLDGGLRAQRTFLNQTTIVRGDSKEPLIMLAALAAKVTRDRYMRRLHVEYPQYAFDQHKGYGTALHYTALQKYGPSPVHRRSFLGGLQ
ncbi:MAG: ribonuclease HII [Parcubacteria group bacterium]|nr:ribonuclease HII [Parcubacteria group bacterium]